MTPHRGETTKMPKKDKAVKPAAKKKTKVAQPKAAKVSKPKKARETKPKKVKASKAKAAKAPKMPPPAAEQSEKLLSSEIVFEGPLFRVLRDRLIEPGGQENARDIIRHNGSVVILAVDDTKNKRR